MKRTPILVIALALTLASSPAAAKEGFYTGAFIPFDSLSGDIKGVDSGSGLGVRIGYGLNKYLALEGSAFITRHDINGGGNTYFNGKTIDLKLDLPLTGSNLEPYFLIGVGAYELKGGGFFFSGSGTQYGLGLDIYMFPELSFNAGLTWRNITFATGFPGDTTEKVTTFDIGLTYHFL